MTEPAFHGVCPVLYAFHHHDGSLDVAAMNRQVEHCLANGANGLMVLGLITEVRKHSTAERHQIVETVSAALGGRKPLMVTLGEPTQAEQLSFAQSALSNG